MAIATERQAFHRHFKHLWVWVVLVAVAATAVTVRRNYWPTPSEALQDFYEYGLGADDGVTEDMLMDPLILGGDDVVPLVLAALPNKEMPRRRYAIAFLGNGAYRQALPVLRQVLADEEEAAIVRGDAFDAICHIDPAEGKQRAPTFAHVESYLGARANEVLTKGCPINRRTRDEVGCHDCDEDAQ